MQVHGVISSLLTFCFDVLTADLPPHAPQHLFARWLPVALVAGRPPTTSRPGSCVCNGCYRSSWRRMGCNEDKMKVPQDGSRTP